MFHSFKPMVIAIATAIFATATAQNFNSTPDIIYGQRCYKESDGKYYAHGDKNGTGSLEWPSASNVQVVYYLHVPEGHTKMLAYITPKKTCALRLKVSDPESQSIIYETEVGASGTKSVGLEMFSDFNFPADKWYRFEFSASSGQSSIASIDKLEFYRESTKNITTSAIFMAPSTHLNSSTLVGTAPTGQSYDWGYEEVMYPSKYERGARYVEAMNLLKGYMGIQYTEKGNRNVIFSMWDNGSTDTDPNLPEYLRSGFMDGDPRLTVERFRGEGTGQKTIFEFGQYYRPDTWVQFLFNARPELVNVTLSGTNGHDTTIVYSNTITTAWYKMADDPDWTYISTIRASGANNYFNSYTSFLENFGDNGCEYTRAYWRNPYMRSVASGKWYPITHFTFTHTQGTSARNSRSDYGHGVTEVYPNAWYMEHGAFTTTVNDSSQYSGVPLDQTCVDTIDIDAKIARVNQAIMRNNAQQTTDRLLASGEVYDLSTWEVVGYSDQEETVEENNGWAKHAVDGNPKTYWQNKWKNGGVTYPHWIALKAPKPVTISQLTLNSTKTYLYWPKSVVVHTSNDGTNWTVATDTVTISRTANSTTNFANRVTAQYFKIEFVDAYGAMLYINEMGLSTDISSTKIMEYAEELLSKSDEFNSYLSEDLAPLREIYADGQGNPDAVREAINELASTKQVLKYGGTKYTDHLSSLRNYQISSSRNYGKLITDGEQLTIGGSAITSALKKYTNKVNIRLPENNWRIIRCEEQQFYYIYNQATGKYLDLSSATLWSDTPKQVLFSSTWPQYEFTIRSGNKYLCLDPKSETEPIKASSSLTDGCYFNIYDNYYLTPSQSDAKKLLDECQDYASFSTYLTKADYMLKIPEGRVGYPLGDSRTRLEQVYNKGNIDISQRHALYEAVDSCERIPCDPTLFCYRLKSGYLTASPYITATKTPAITGKEYDANDPAQIWSFRPRIEGLSPSAQNTVLGRLPNYSYEDIPAAKSNESRQFGTYYITEIRPGTFVLSTTQQGGICMSNRTIGQSIGYNADYAGYYLELVDNFDITLNETGLRGINYNFDIILPENLQVYVVDNIEGNTANLKRVYDRLPAGTPAIIRGEANQNITLHIAAPAAIDPNKEITWNDQQYSTAIGKNLLRGTYFEESVSANNIYTLTTDQNGIFAKSASANVSANSVYLTFKDEETPGDAITLNFSDEPTNVTSVTTSDNASDTYDLQGHKVNEHKHGIVIKNKEKVRQ